MPESKYRRVVLKLSGEAFADRSLGFGIDSDVVHRMRDMLARNHFPQAVILAGPAGSGKSTVARCTS